MQERDRPALRVDRLTPLRALGLVARRVERRLDERLRPLKVSTSDGWLLLALLDAGQLRTSALARTLGVTLSTMTEMADRMERAGWITRERDPLDRRAVTLRLTEAGHALALEVGRTLATIERSLTRLVSAADRESFGRVLEAMLQAIA